MVRGVGVGERRGAVLATEAAEGVQAVPGAVLNSRSAPTVDVHIYVTAVRSALLWTHCFVVEHQLKQKGKLSA